MESFWAHVAIRGRDDCWLWDGPPHEKDGYGRFTVRHGLRVYAHRFAYELAHGPIPAGMLIRHRCDTPLCCNPHHLLLGRQLENARDAVERGQIRRGERAGAAKLTSADVAYIRQNPDRLSQAALAARYSVSQSVISNARSGVTWAHEPPAPAELDLRFKLTDTDRAAIRAARSTLSIKSIARRWGVHRQTVRRVLRGC